MKKVMLTGHRPGKKLNDVEALAGMKSILERLSVDDDIIVITGGADGADRLWARSAMRLKIPYHLYVPNGYSAHYKLGEWFTNMLWAADEIVWTQAGPFEIKYNFVRNTQMVEAADVHVVCSYKSPELLVKTTKSGGTRHCANEILKRSITPIWLNSLTGEIDDNAS